MHVTLATYVSYFNTKYDLYQSLFFFLPNQKLFFDNTN